MFIKIIKLVPMAQSVVIHAHLPEVEWIGTRRHIRHYISESYTYIEVQAKKTFFEMIDHRQKFPSPATRQCTSDLKRGPIEKAIRKVSKDAGKPLIVNCMGLRAEESPGRAKQTDFKFNERNSKAGREWYDMSPIHKMKETEVLQTIEDAGQKPHWAYSKGMSRLSCCFCIMSNKNDLRVAAKWNPDLYRRYVEKEKELNFTVSMSRKFLPEITGISI